MKIVKRSVSWVGLVLAAGLARAEEAGEAGKNRSQTEPRAAATTSDAFDRACVDLLHGKAPHGEDATWALKEACEKLMKSRAEAAERRATQVAIQEQLGARQVQPGQAAAAAQPGEGVLAAFEAAGSELMGRSSSRLPLGMRRGGPVGYTLITNPIGWFSGLGVNAELHGVIPDQEKLSWVAGARFSQTDATNGEVSTFGAMGGIDWYIYGRNNEGFRVGPRVELAAGREDFGDNNFGRMGVGAEVGYSFIALNGITALVAGGLGGRVAGDDENDDFSSFVGGEFGPYAKVGLGFSW